MISSLPKQFELHGNPVTVITSDLEDTIIQYENGAQRYLDTGDLFNYLDLKVFPAKSRFCRAVNGKKEVIIIQEVTTDFYKWETPNLTAGSNIACTIFTDLIKWHMDGDKLDPEIELVPGTRLYTPKVVEAAETDPQKRIAQLQAEIAEANRRISELTNELLQQETIHDTRVITMADEIERLREKTAISVPVVKQFDYLRNATAADLDRHSRDGWAVDHYQVEQGILYAVFSRPASTQPSVQPSVGEAVTEIIVPGEGEPKTIVHTFNRGERGDTRKVTIPADDPVLQEAFKRGQAVYNRVISEGMSAINQASRSFNQGA